MPRFFDLTPGTLKDECAALDLPPYLATQLLDWVYAKGVVDPDRMTNLSKSNRAKVAEHFTFYDSELAAHQTASDGTEKLLLRWSSRDVGWVERAQRAKPTDVATKCDKTTTPREDGGFRSALPTLRPQSTSARETECVMIPTASAPDSRPRRTACVSSQVGCPVGCTFCASGLGGLDGNLSAGQIVEQVHRLSQRSEVRGQKSEFNTEAPTSDLRPLTSGITNVVFMGMGEPLANLTNVTNAIRTLNASWGMGIGARKITVSTVGLPKAIRKFVEFEIPVTLALSLHAPNDDLRRTLIPWAEYATIEEILDACDEYFAKSGREITLEYLLLRNVNDRIEHAKELAALAKRLRANVNLIRYNEVRGLPFDRPTTEDVRAFQDVLRTRKVNAHLRASRGRDIAAACGQLRHERRM